MPNKAKQRRDVIADEAIGARVRRRRLELGKSQTELATACGVTFQQVQKYENGHNRISASRLLTIADVLETDVAMLIGSNGGNHQASPAERFLATKVGVDALEAMQEMSTAKKRLSLAILRLIRDFRAT